MIVFIAHFFTIVNTFLFCFLPVCNTLLSRIILTKVPGLKGQRYMWNSLMKNFTFKGTTHYFVLILGVQTYNNFSQNYIQKKNDADILPTGKIWTGRFFDKKTFWCEYFIYFLNILTNLILTIFYTYWDIWQLLHANFWQSYLVTFMENTVLYFTVLCFVVKYI